MRDEGSLVFQARVAFPSRGIHGDLLFSLGRYWRKCLTGTCSLLWATRELWDSNLIPGVEGAYIGCQDRYGQDHISGFCCLGTREHKEQLLNKITKRKKNQQLEIQNNFLLHVCQASFKSAKFPGRSPDLRFLAAKYARKIQVKTTVVACHGFISHVQQQWKWYRIACGSKKQLNGYKC